MGEQRAEATLNRFEVHPDCWGAVCAFLACDTQWRISEVGRTGLDLGAALAVAQFMGQGPTPALLADLKLMEREALRLWAIEAARR